MSDSLVGSESCEARGSKGSTLAHWQITTDMTVLKTDAIEQFNSANDLAENGVTDYVFLHELDHRFFFHTIPLQTVFHLNAEACAFLVKYAHRITKTSKVELLQKSIKRRANHQDVVPLLEAEALFNAEVTPRYQKVASVLVPTSGPILKTLRRLRRLHKWSGSKDLVRLSVYMGHARRRRRGPHGTQAGRSESH